MPLKTKAALYAPHLLLLAVPLLLQIDATATSAQQDNFFLAKGSNRDRISRKFRSYVKKNLLAAPPTILNYSSIKNSSLRLKANELAFGQIISSTGSNALYARQIFCGTAAYFMSINNAGGLANKHFLRLVPVDDHGDPVLTLKIERTLLKKHKINVFLGNMGERNILAVLPDIKRGAIFALFPFAFNKALKSPFLTHVINGTNDKELQIDKFIDFLLHKQKLKNIAIFHQNDELGSYLAKYTEARLIQAKVYPSAVVSYHLKHMEIIEAAKTLKKIGPDAVISLGSFMPSCRLISQFFRTNHANHLENGNATPPSPQHDSPETIFIGTEDMYFAAKILEDCLGDYCSNIYFTSFVPLPDKSRFHYKIVQEYLRNLNKYFHGEEPSPLGLSYYINAKITARILEERIIRHNNKITQSDLKDVLRQGFYNIDYCDLGGFIASNTNGNRSSIYPLEPHIFNLRKRNQKRKRLKRLEAGHVVIVPKSF
jgi:ABC-type branched-subunit amino acid transport system substrate-binding protein